jgi:hypothetical protein
VQAIGCKKALCQNVADLCQNQLPPAIRIKPTVKTGPEEENAIIKFPTAAKASPIIDDARAPYLATNQRMC